ncbi:MAG: hypothetical protein QOJ29_3589 [Thermoleophilaceae bacterium]|nr:hypothetical protein [Thermoleophilaceae bacterium]
MTKFDFSNEVQISGRVEDIDEVSVRTGTIYKVLIMQSTSRAEYGHVVKLFREEGARFVDEVQLGDTVRFEAHLESRLYNGRWLSDIVHDDHELIERGSGTAASTPDADLGDIPF